MECVYISVVVAVLFSWLIFYSSAPFIAEEIESLKHPNGYIQIKSFCISSFPIKQVLELVAKELSPEQGLCPENSSLKQVQHNLLKIMSTTLESHDF